MKNKISVESGMSEDGESIKNEITVSEDIKNLLNLFVCKDEGMKEVCLSFKEVTRYKIKSALVKSLNWQSFYDLLFMKDLVDTGRLIIYTENNNIKKEFIRIRKDRMNDFIKVMVELSNTNKVSVEYIIKEVEDDGN